MLKTSPDARRWFCLNSWRNSSSSSKVRLERADAHHRGYTMIEVMMALAVLAVGAVGVISLQNVAVMSGLASRNLTSATNTAASWIERAQTEATAWRQPDNSDATTVTNMPVLATALTTPGTWFDLPATAGKGETALDGGPAGALNIAYCSQVRAVYLGAPATADIVSFQVRTYFARNGRALTDGAECGSGVAGFMDTALTTAHGAFGSRTRDEYGFVFLAGTVRRNTL